MSDSTVGQMSVGLERAEDTPRSSLLGSLSLVVGFWWAATGLTLAMQRTAVASTASLILTSVLAACAVALLFATRNQTSVRAARLAFLASALVWWWCASLFYAGVGIAIADNVRQGPRTLALALDAIVATLRPDLAGVVALIVIGAIVWRRPNRLAFWTFAAFWGTLQTAKLNVFFGVRNAGVEWLPPHLAGLSQYFGPPQNSELLPVTVVVLLAILLLLLQRMRGGVVSRSRAENAPLRRPHFEFVRHSSAMLAFLIALAILEHVFLGLSSTLPLWNLFMPQS